MRHPITVIASVYGEPELRFTPSGRSVVSMRCYSKDRKKDNTGTYVDAESWWFDVEAWGGDNQHLAEHIAESVTRGDTLVITGRIKVDSWEDKTTGDKRTKEVIVADEVGMSLRWTTYKRDAAPDVSHSPRRQAEGQSADPWAGQDDSPPF